MKKRWIYFLFCLPIGFVRDWIQIYLSGPIVVAVALAYFFVARLIADRFGR